MRKKPGVFYVKMWLPAVCGLVWLITFFLPSCSKEAVSCQDALPRDEVNEWIYQVMNHNYLWYKDIPDSEKLDFTLLNERFFLSLLSPLDRSANGQTPYSDIRSKAMLRRVASSSPSYGFRYLVVLLSGNTCYAKVLYVLPGSAAERAGLYRGDRIDAVDGEMLTFSNYTRFGSGDACLLSVRRLNDSGETAHVEVSLPAAQEVDDNPLFLSRLFPVSTDENVGYIVYNHFTPGFQGRYDQYLKQTLLAFRDKGVKKLVLDLRYNRGGNLSSCLLLATMLAPRHRYGMMAAYNQYNDKVMPSVGEAKFAHELLTEEDYLPIDHLYVLTTELTASASEALINILKPYVEVTIVGARTEGKNVGSVCYTKTGVDYELYPIVFKIYNALGESDYSMGFQPDYAVSEGVFVWPLGSRYDPLLSMALSLIEKGHVQSSRVSESSGGAIHAVCPSLTGGVEGLVDDCVKGRQP